MNSSPQPLASSDPSWWRRIFDRLVPALPAPTTRPVMSPGWRAGITVGVSALVLTLLHYIILRSGLQNALVELVPRLAGHFYGDEAAKAARRYSELTANLAWAAGCSFFYLVVPVAVIRVIFREPLSDWHLSVKGYWRHLFFYGVLFIPVAVAISVVASDPQFQFTYPFYRHPVARLDFLVWEAAYAMQFIALEFFFRGFMLRGTAPAFGTGGAIAIMVIPYTMLHFQKPPLESAGAIIAGAVLGALALRTRSIWGGATLHIAVAFTMDAAALAHRAGH